MKKMKNPFDEIINCSEQVNKRALGKQSKKFWPEFEDEGKK